MTFDIDFILETLEKEVSGYAVPIVDLIAVQTKDPFKILVATILSARTKDETTAGASARLFKRVGDADGLSRLSEDEIAKLIYPVGFYKNKAGYLAKLPEALQAFGGRVPDDIDSLVTLPGVGRKTANLVVCIAFGKPAICVDTHVHRIMNIWGYVDTKTPLQTEKALRDKLPDKHWLRVNSILVAFGQGTCRPVGPHCDSCVIQGFCPQIGVTPRKSPQSRQKIRFEGIKKFISWNVNGIRAIEKKGFVEIIREMDSDILALQETKARPEQLSQNLINIDGYHSFWHSAQKKGYSGVAVYSRQEPLKVYYGIEQKEFDEEGRVLTLEFADFFLVNVYFPNAAHGLKRLDYKLDFNRRLLCFANGLADKKSVVICGDFNVAHKAIDLKNPENNVKNPGFTPEERAWMDEFINAGYLDTFRKFYSGPNHYTWWSYRFNARARDIGWRIDYFCVDKKSENRIENVSILKDVMGSDHCPVSLDFR